MIFKQTRSQGHLITRGLLQLLQPISIRLVAHLISPGDLMQLVFGCLIASFRLRRFINS